MRGVLVECWGFNGAREFLAIPARLRVQSVYGMKVSGARLNYVDPSEMSVL